MRSTGRIASWVHKSVSSFKSYRPFSSVADKRTNHDEKISAEDTSTSDENDEHEFYREEAFTQKLGNGIFRNEHYVPLSAVQKAIITVGSGLYSFFDPTKAGTNV